MYVHVRAVICMSQCATVMKDLCVTLPECFPESGEGSAAFISKMRLAGKGEH